MCTEAAFPFQPWCKGLHAVIWEPLGLLRLWDTDSVLNLPLGRYCKKKENPALSTTSLEQMGSLQHYLLKLLQQAVPAASGKSCLASWEGCEQQSEREHAPAPCQQRTGRCIFPWAALLVNNQSPKHRICHLQQLKEDAQQEETPHPWSTTVQRSPHASHTLELLAKNHFALEERAQGWEPGDLAEELQTHF